MKPSSREAAKAEALAGFRDAGPGHLNCSQAVMLSGLLMMGEDPSSIGIAGYLGGGMVRSGNVCGALSGGIVTLGLLDQPAPDGREKDSGVNRAAVTDALQQFMRDFELEFGAVTCRELTGYDISTPEKYREARAAKALDRCPEYVSWACDRLATILHER